MTPRRVSVWLLALAGVALGHVVGYAVAHPGAWVSHLTLESHAYFPGLLAAAVPVGIAAALVHSVRHARSIGGDSPVTVRHLALLQIGGFAVQEIGERLAGGVSPGALVGSLLGEPGVAYGLVAQVAVAAVLVAAVRWTTRVVRHVLQSAPKVTGRAPLRLLPAGRLTAPVGKLLVGIVPVRGPPVVSS